MAPVKSHRRTARARVARSRSQLGQYAPPSPTENSPDEEVEDATGGAEMNGDEDFGFGVGLKLSKKDKRMVKHNTLLNRVREAGISKTGTVKKRRRPAKKLKTDMGGLEDALPDIEDMDKEEEDWEGISEDENQGQEIAVVANPINKKRRRKAAAENGKIQMTSMKHKPGAMKKKFEMEGRERERFGRNLAGLMGGKSGDKDGRWAALRGFIEGTMERDRAFGGK